MTTEHQVLSDEYVNSRMKQHKQGKALFTVLAVILGFLGIAVTIAEMVMDSDYDGTNFVILSFVSIAIVVSVRGRHDTLLENKRLWDRASS